MAVCLTGREMRYPLLCIVDSSDHVGCLQSWEDDAIAGMDHRVEHV